MGEWLKKLKNLWDKSFLGKIWNNPFLNRDFIHPLTPEKEVYNEPPAGTGEKEAEGKTTETASYTTLAATRNARKESETPTPPASTPPSSSPTPQKKEAQESDPYESMPIPDENTSPLSKQEESVSNTPAISPAGYIATPTQREAFEKIVQNANRGESTKTTSTTKTPPIPPRDEKSPKEVAENWETNKNTVKDFIAEMEKKESHSEQDIKTLESYLSYVTTMKPRLPSDHPDTNIVASYVESMTVLIKTSTAQTIAATETPTPPAPAPTLGNPNYGRLPNKGDEAATNSQHRAMPPSPEDRFAEISRECDEALDKLEGDITLAGTFIKGTTPTNDITNLQGSTSKLQTDWEEKQQQAISGRGYTEKEKKELNDKISNILAHIQELSKTLSTKSSYGPILTPSSKPSSSPPPQKKEAQESDRYESMPNPTDKKTPLDKQEESADNAPSVSPASYGLTLTQKAAFKGHTPIPKRPKQAGQETAETAPLPIPPRTPAPASPQPPSRKAASKDDVTKRKREADQLKDLKKGIIHYAELKEPQDKRIKEAFGKLVLNERRLNRSRRKKLLQTQTLKDLLALAKDSPKTLKSINDRMQFGRFVTEEFLAPFNKMTEEDQIQMVRYQSESSKLLMREVVDLITNPAVKDAIKPEKAASPSQPPPEIKIYSPFPTSTTAPTVASAGAGAVPTYAPTEAEIVAQQKILNDISYVVKLQIQRKKDGEITQEALDSAYDRTTQHFESNKVNLTPEQIAEAEKKIDELFFQTTKGKAAIPPSLTSSYGAMPPIKEESETTNKEQEGTLNAYDELPISEPSAPDSMVAAETAPPPVTPTTKVAPPRPAPPEKDTVIPTSELEKQFSKITENSEQERFFEKLMEAKDDKERQQMLEHQTPDSLQALQTHIGPKRFYAMRAVTPENLERQTKTNQLFSFVTQEFDRKKPPETPEEAHAKKEETQRVRAENEQSRILGERGRSESEQRERKRHRGVEKDSAIIEKATPLLNELIAENNDNKRQKTVKDLPPDSLQALDKYLNLRQTYARTTESMEQDSNISHFVKQELERRKSLETPVKAAPAEIPKKPKKSVRFADTPIVHEIPRTEIRKKTRGKEKTIVQVESAYLTAIEKKDTDAAKDMLAEVSIDTLALLHDSLLSNTTSNPDLTSIALQQIREIAHDVILEKQFSEFRMRPEAENIGVAQKIYQETIAGHNLFFEILMQAKTDGQRQEMLKHQTPDSLQALNEELQALNDFPSEKGERLDRVSETLQFVTQELDRRKTLETEPVVPEETKAAPAKTAAPSPPAHPSDTAQPFLDNYSESLEQVDGVLVEAKGDLSTSRIDELQEWAKNLEAYCQAEKETIEKSSYTTQEKEKMDNMVNAIRTKVTQLSNELQQKQDEAARIEQTSEAPPTPKTAATEIPAIPPHLEEKLRAAMQHRRGGETQQEEILQRNFSTLKKAEKNKFLREFITDVIDVGSILDQQPAKSLPIFCKFFEDGKRHPKRTSKEDYTQTKEEVFNYLLNLCKKQYSTDWKQEQQEKFLTALTLLNNDQLKEAIKAQDTTSLSALKDKLAEKGTEEKKSIISIIDEVLKDNPAPPASTGVLYAPPPSHPPIAPTETKTAKAAPADQPPANRAFLADIRKKPPLKHVGSNRGEPVGKPAGEPVDIATMLREGMKKQRRDVGEDVQDILQKDLPKLETEEKTRFLHAFIDLGDDEQIDNLRTQPTKSLPILRRLFEQMDKEELPRDITKDTYQKAKETFSNYLLEICKTQYSSGFSAEKQNEFITALRLLDDKQLEEIFKTQSLDSLGALKGKLSDEKQQAGEQTPEGQAIYKIFTQVEIAHKKKSSEEVQAPPPEPTTSQ